MNLIRIIFISVPITLIASIITMYNIRDSVQNINDKNRCQNCRYYMSEIETRTDRGSFSLCSERYISVLSTDICDKYRK